MTAVYIQVPEGFIGFAQELPGANIEGPRPGRVNWALGGFLIRQGENMTAFIAKQVTRSYVQQIDFPPDAVFPLLCPVREAEWLDGWDYELIYSASGYAEKDCVFKSKHVGEPDTIWLITEHDTENYRIGFARVTPGSRVAKVEIGLRENADGTTSAEVTYVVTALSEEGNRFVEGYTEESFRRAMRWWEQSMNHYLKRGEKLRRESV